VTGPLDLFAAAEAERQTRRDGEGDPPRTTYSVSTLNRLVRELLDQSLPALWVAGEISNWTRSAAGHCYFTLKDADAQLRCVLFASDARRLPTDPEEGMGVRAFGAVSLYEPRGDYQLIVRELEASDAGGLWRLAFEKLRRTLEAEGLMDPARKRPLPRFPRRVGLVTSPVGAAVHDVLRVIEARAPWCTVVLSPAKVQGDGAEEEIADALARLTEHGDVDVVIVGRGGGSVEDLWAFNREGVARAIAASPVPVVSAVGHETDVTIADLVADARVPTPSAAAERVVPDRQEVRGQLRMAASRVGRAVERLITDQRRRVDDLATALESSVDRLIEARARRLNRGMDKLEALSPLASLERGYSVALDPEGRVLRRVADFEAGDRIRLRVVDGRVACTVDGTEREGDE
jgi:exodeoxyribonuclease VII large subunit